MKKEQSYNNDDIVKFVEVWFENHKILTNENYIMERIYSCKFKSS